MEHLTEDKIKELREVFGIKEEVSIIDMSILTCTKGSFEEENNTDKCEEDYSSLERKLKELEKDA